MLFVENYDAKSLDRSSVSMIDKYNGRLSIVGTLLIRLSALIDNLLSLIIDVRNTLGQCKQRVYDNLNQAKEVISGNSITGTESIVNVIESTLAAGDTAIAQAEATLEGVQQEINCNESALVVQDDCGEDCNEEVNVEENIGCFFTIDNIMGGDSCAVCTQGTCTVDQTCSEDKPWMGGAGDIVPGCQYTVEYDGTGNKTTIDLSCMEVTRDGATEDPPENCTYTCSDNTSCHQAPMPENCTYSTVVLPGEGDPCAYSGTDCAYGIICNESCDQSEPEIEACGNCGEGYGCGDWSEFCGEVGGGSTGEGDEGCGDCGDCGNCGEGEGCGDWSEFCGE